MLVDIVINSKKTRNPESSSKDGLKRTLAKTISWRVIGTLDTVIIAYIITGTINSAISIGGIELVTKMALYFFHERTWNKINWGK